MDNEGKKTPDEVAWIIFNVAEGLKYAHSKGIIHRDLKPSNILLKAGIPKISDWGLSKIIGEDKTITAVFTPYYAAPEQISPEAFGGADQRTDIWQLGVIFYELLTGKKPFERDSFTALAKAITTENPKPLGEINPDAKPLEFIVMKMLAKRKEEHYQSVEELQRDLAKVLGIKYREELSKSITTGDFSHSKYYAGQLALVHLNSGDIKDALKYLLDLQRYTGGRNPDLNWLVEQVKLAMDEGIKLGEDAVKKAEVIIYEITTGKQ